MGAGIPIPPQCRKIRSCRAAECDPIPNPTGSLSILVGVSESIEIIDRMQKISTPPAPALESEPLTLERLRLARQRRGVRPSRRQAAQAIVTIGNGRGRERIRTQWGSGGIQPAARIVCK